MPYLRNPYLLLVFNRHLKRVLHKLLTGPSSCLITLDFQHGLYLELNIDPVAPPFSDILVIVTLGLSFPPYSAI